MEYPRMVKLNDPKLLELEKEKGRLIEEGRAISKQIEDIGLEAGKIDIRLQNEESKVDIKDLKLKGDKVAMEMDNSLKYFKQEIQKVQQEIFDRMAAKTNPELRKQHQELEKKKAELETERNKKALKAQKFKDRILAIVPKVAKQYLENEYEDYFDLELKDGEMVLRIFSHLEDFKANFKKKLANK